MRLRSNLLRARLLLCALFFLPTLPAEESTPDPFPALWAEVERLRLWDDPEWWTLGHYHRTLWGRVESRIDDPRFFLHPRGKTDRRAELLASLQEFLKPAPEPAGGEVVPPRSLACRFPARREWLLRRLNLPDSVFPAGDCGDYQAALQQLRIESAAMIYPAGYLNSPASMFGHLLLVLDREGKDRLLSRAVNYAAVVGDSFGPLFAIKGIFGLYRGVFAILPYYDKVEEYSAVNRRDIWEYPLRLDAAELDRLLRHVWELQELESRYFFFKENCAFNLLYPLEVAQPGLRMTRRFRMSAVPVSLLRDLAKTGVMGDPLYRPSKATRMRHLSDQLTPEQRRRAKELVSGAEPAADENPLTLSLAVEWVQFLYTERELDPETYRQRVFPLLRARSRLGQVDLPEPPAPAPPHLGHAPRRFTLYGGAETLEGRALAGVKLRAAYHDWMDDPAGYPPGASIRMFEVDGQMDLENGHLHLREFALVDIRSLAPPEPWVFPLSWSAGLWAESAPADPDHHRGFARFSTGKTLSAGASALVWLMLSQEFRVDSELQEAIAWEPGVEWGLTAGTGRLRGGLRGGHAFGVWGSTDQRHRVEAELRWSVTRDFSLGLAWRQRREQGGEEREALFSLYRTF